MYWIKLYKDIRLWRKFAKIAKSSREKLETMDLRVDNLGRIYTVINLPKEVVEGNEYMHEAWVLQNLGPYNKALEAIGLAGYAVPEISRIDEPGSAAYLLVLWPDTPTVTAYDIIKNIIIWGLGYILIRVLYRVSTDFIDYSSLWSTIKSYIF
jgi:hypothetical protein